jgi:uncharacterized protein YqhQ
MPFLPVGGQAVIEGVMMRSPSRVAVAVRRGDGTLAFLERPFRSVTRRFKPLGWPVVRGAVSLFETLGLGVSALNFSAEEASREEGTAPAAKPSFGQQALQGATLVLSFTLGLFLFVVLPARVTGALGFHDRIGFGLVDGFFRLVVFVLYLVLISRWSEMRRVLAYHGAEHKSIHAIESGAPLTPESVMTFSRLHPRCGTSFLFLVVVVSVVVFSFIGKPSHIGDHLLRIACMPLIAGIAFEFVRLSGRHAGRRVVRWLTWPGLQFQRLTTREPDAAMCAVAIAALERVRNDETVVALERAAGTAPAAEMAFIQ